MGRVFHLPLASRHCPLLVFPDLFPFHFPLLLRSTTHHLLKLFPAGNSSLRSRDTFCVNSSHTTLLSSFSAHSSITLTSHDPCNKNAGTPWGIGARESRTTCDLPMDLRPPFEVHRSQAVVQASPLGSDRTGDRGSAQPSGHRRLPRSEWSESPSVPA